MSGPARRLSLISPVEESMEDGVTGEAAHVPVVIDFERARTGLRGMTPGEVCPACSDPGQGRWVPASFCERASAAMSAGEGSMR